MTSFDPTPVMRRHAAEDTLIQAAMTVWPWPDYLPLAVGVEHGIPWAIRPGPCGGINGYVLIPAEGHPWSAGIPDCDCGDEDCLHGAADQHIDVHGGFTYGGFAGDTGWIGFDTNHGPDRWDDHTGYPNSWHIHAEILGTAGMRVWTVDDAIAETKRLARQLAEVG